MKIRIRDLRTSKKITQTSLALAIGCSQNVISKIELEYSVPDADILCKIADYFHTSVIIYCIELIRDIAWPLSHLHSIHE